jgi:GAF domain-containing protein
MTQMRNDPARLAVLRRLMILESSPEQAYNDIVSTLSADLNMPVTMVNVLDERRDWFKACVGLLSSESSSDTSFCGVMFQSRDMFIVVPDTSLDQRFATHPLVVEEPKVRFYAAARLVVEGQTIGTICAYDFKPRMLTAEQLETMRLLAKAATSLLVDRLQNPPPAV